MKLNLSTLSFGSSLVLLVLTFGLSLASAESSTTNPAIAPVTVALLNCARSASCGQAARYWLDCTNKFNNSEIQIIKPVTGQGSNEPDSSLRSCLCESGYTDPSYPTWSHELYLCSVCVDLAIGGDGLTFPGEIFAETGVPSEPGTPSGFCPGNITYETMVSYLHDLQISYNFPLLLPDAILKTVWSSDGGKDPTAPFTTLSACSPSPSSSVSKASLAPTITSPAICNQDNCFRQAIQSSAVVSSFRRTYTTKVNTASTGLPAVVSQCSSKPAAVSSACTCLDGMVTQTIQDRGNCNEDNCYRQFIRSSAAVASFCSTYTTAVSASSGNLPRMVSHCQSDPSRVSSACSCLALRPTQTITMGGSIPASVIITTSSSSLPTSSSLPSSLTQIHASTHQSTNPAVTTSSAADPFTNGPWITLPPSDEMKACITTDGCKRAARIFNGCMNQLNGRGNDTENWICFCEVNIDTWKSTMDECTTCIASALPVSPRLNVSSNLLPVWVDNYINDFCNVTDIGLKVTSEWRLVQLGLALTELWESPIAFFNMTLIESPIYATISTDVLEPSNTPLVSSGQHTTFTTTWVTITLTAPKSTTIATTASAISGTTPTLVSNSKSVSISSSGKVTTYTTTWIIVTETASNSATLINTKSAPSASSANPLVASSTDVSPTNIHTPPLLSSTVNRPTATQTANPNTSAAQKCLSETSCEAARFIYNNCTSLSTAQDNTATWNCFCKKNIAQYNENMLNCLTCISDTLPPQNISHTLYDPAHLADIVLTTYFNDIYCKALNESFNQNITTNFLVDEGWDLTYGFGSQILLYNLTLLPLPLEDTLPVAAIAFSIPPASTTSNPLSLATGLAPSPSGTWDSLPASPAALSCLESAGCHNARKVFDYCATLAPLGDGYLWGCFCDVNLQIWNSSLTSCVNCFMPTLPPGTKTTGYPPSGMLNEVGLVQKNYCNYTTGLTPWQVFLDVGNNLAYFYESPILFWNLTVVTKPLTLVHIP